MITKKQYEDAVNRTIELMNKAGLVITDEEKGNIEIADFGLSDLDNAGLEIIVYVNTAKVCAKELVMFPRQTCIEHIHPTIGDVPGKEETFRCRWGKVYLYVEGEGSEADIQCEIPDVMKGHVTVFKEIVLNPGEQYTLYPDTLHWFQSGDEGAIVSEFSTTNTDETDIFTDPNVERFTKIE